MPNKSKIILLLVIVLSISCAPVDVSKNLEPTQQSYVTLQADTPSEINDSEIDAISLTPTLLSPLIDPTIDVTSTEAAPKPKEEPTKPNGTATSVSIPVAKTPLSTTIPTDFKGLLIAGFSDNIVIYDLGNDSYHELDDQTTEPVAWSFDGCSLLYKGSNLKLYNTNIRNFEPILVIDDKSWKNPVWSPTGNWIAYDDDSGITNIVKPDGSEKTEIFGNESKSYLLGWTEDGSEVIIWSEINGYSNILAINIETMQPRVLTDLKFLDDLRYSKQDAELAVLPGPWLLAPNSSRILLPLRDIQGLHNIELLGVLDFQTNNFNKLYDKTIVDFGIDWSPNSDSIVLAAKSLDGDSNTISRTYIMNINSGNIQLLETPVFNNGGDDRPTWAPDNSMLAIQGWLQPYILKIDNNDVILLDDTLFKDAQIMWSPRSAYGADDCLQQQSEGTN